MVRAAVSGAIDFSRADPTDRQWRLRLRLILSEIQRREDLCVLAASHQHWAAHLSANFYTVDHFKLIQAAATETLQLINKVVFPWDNEKINKATKKATIIDEDTQKLIDAYKEWQGLPKTEQAVAEQ